MKMRAWGRGSNAAMRDHATSFLRSVIDADTAIRTNHDDHTYTGRCLEDMGVMVGSQTFFPTLL